MLNEKGIKFNNDEKEKITKWIKYIGEYRYNKVYGVAKVLYVDELVPAHEVIGLMKFDFKLADILFSAIKFVENYLTSIILKECGNLKISKYDYLYKMSEALGDEEHKLPCNTFYESRLEDNCTVEEFINQSGLSTILKCFFSLTDEKLKNAIFLNKSREKLKDDLYKIKDLRNTISHCGMLVNKIKFDDKKLITNFKNEILNVMRYIPSKETAKRKVTEINALINTCFNENGKIYAKMNQFFRIGEMDENKN